jgi:Immunity protein 26
MKKDYAGNIIRIEIGSNRCVYARIVPGIATIIEVLNFVDIVDLENVNFNFNKIINNPILFYCGIYSDLIKKGTFKTIGNVPYIEGEKTPAFFMQNMLEINDCKMFWNDGNSVSVSAIDCIGLERSSVWDKDGLITRIHDALSGKKNPNVELNKVILSADDPRATDNPTLLRWSFEKEMFYLI